MSRSLAASQRCCLKNLSQRYRTFSKLEAMAPSRRDLHSSQKKASQGAGATYKHQSSLPHLPIPSISNTAAKFLDSARPFVSDPSPGAPLAGEQNPNKAYNRLKSVVKDFEDSDLIKELQTRLENHAKGKDSWLIDWFNSANYFGDPLYILALEQSRASIFIPAVTSLIARLP